MRKLLSMLAMHHVMFDSAAAWQVAYVVAPAHDPRILMENALARPTGRRCQNHVMNEDSNKFSAARWHRKRRRQILSAHAEKLHPLLKVDDTWVAGLGLPILSLFYGAIAYAPEMPWPMLLLSAYSVGSLRASWSIYCSHAISHGRWRNVTGPVGSGRFNMVLAMVNTGHMYQVLPSYWLTHASHHTKLGTLALHEARARAKRAVQTDGDLGIATRLFSPPAHKYSLVLDRSSDKVIPRQSEPLHQVFNLLVHALGPLGFVGYLVAAIGTDSRTADAKLRTSLIFQSASSLINYVLVAAASVAADSWTPLALYVLSSFLWLTPLNPNWIWGSPHLSEPGSLQPSVSFYTPKNALGMLLDIFMGFENYHVEHHDFPEVPNYLLPRLREIAPEHYEHLSKYNVLDYQTWQSLMTGNYFYACQDSRFLLKDVQEAELKADTEAEPEKASQ